MATLAYNSTIRPAFLAAAATLGTAIAVVKFGTLPIAASLILLWLMILFYYHPLLLTLLWPATLVFQQIFFDQSLSEISSAFANLPILFYPMDAAYFFTIVYLIMTFINRRHKLIEALKENPFLTALIVVVLASVLIYTPVYGKSAIGEARKSFFLFLLPLLTVVSIDNHRDLRVLIFGVLITALCVSSLGYSKAVFGHPVALSGEGALVLLLTIFSIVTMHRNGMVMISRIIDISIIGLFLAELLITQQRSVALAGILALGLLAGLQRPTIPFLLKLMAVSILLFTLVALVFMKIPEFERSFMNRMAGIINPESDQTASWRIRAWQQQLETLSPWELLVGKGVGSYFLWYDRGVKNKVGPHNTYVMVVLKLGLLGLIVYGLLVFRFFRRLLTVRNKVPLGPMRAYIDMSLLNFGAAHAYMVGYDFCLIIVIFYATGMSAVRLLQDSWEVSEQQEWAENSFHCHVGSRSRCRDRRLRAIAKPFKPVARQHSALAIFGRTFLANSDT